MNIKKLIGLIVSFTMLSGLCPAVYAADTALLFEIDLSQAQQDIGGEITGLADKTGFAAAVETSKRDVSGNANVYLKEFDTALGKTKYLQFGTHGSGDWPSDYDKEKLKNESPAVKVVSDKLRKSTGITSHTVEFWARVNQNNLTDKTTPVYGRQSNSNTNSGEVLSLGGASQVNNLKISYNWTDLITDSNKLREDFSKNREKQWAHYAVTALYNSEIKKWDYTVYLNGSLCGYGGITAKSQVDIADESAWNLYIGLGGKENFSGDLATFKYYQGVLSAQEINRIWNDEKPGFQELSDEISFSTSSIADGATNVGVQTEGMTCSFSNIINHNCLDENVKLYDESGIEIEGIQVSAQGNVLSVRWGLLAEKTTYRLWIGSGFSSINGHSLGGDLEISFTTADSCFINESFDSDEYIVGKNAPKTESVYYMLGGASNNSAALVCEENGDKYISLSGTETAEARMVLKPNIELDSSTAFAVEMKIRGRSMSDGNGSAQRKILYLNNNGASFGYMNSADISFPGGVGSLNGEKLSISYSSDRFTYIKAVFIPDDDGMYAIISDDSGNRCKIIPQGSLPDKINDIVAIQIKPSNSAEAADDRIDISEVKGYTLAMPKIFGNNIESFSRAENRIEIFFNKELSDFTGDDVSFDEINGESVDVRVVYERERKSASVYPSAYLKEGKEYCLDFSRVKDTDGISGGEPMKLSFKVPYSSLACSDVRVLDENGDSISNFAADCTVDIAVDVINYGADASASIYALIFAEDGMMYDLRTAEPISLGKDKGGTLRINSVNVKRGEWVKIFLWEEMSFNAAKCIAMKEVGINAAQK